MLKIEKVPWTDDLNHDCINELKSSRPHFAFRYLYTTFIKVYVHLSVLHRTLNKIFSFSVLGYRNQINPRLVMSEHGHSNIF